MRTEKTASILWTGLGLYVTKQMVEKMGGRIGVESAEGAGSTFSVWLPARRPEVPTGAVPSAG